LKSWLLCLFAVTSGCYASVPLAPRSADLEAKTFAPAPVAGRARVYVYQVGGSGTKWKIVVDGQPVGLLTNKTYVVIDVLWGPRTLGANWKEGASSDSKSLQLEAVDGAVYYVRLEHHWWHSNQLMLVTENEGREAISRLRRARDAPGSPQGSDEPLRDDQR
jgi:hypothetical protein